MINSENLTEDLYMNNQKDEHNGQNGKNTVEEKPKFMTIHSIGKSLKAGAGRNFIRTGSSFRGPQAMFHRSPGNAPRRK
jgi:hypothetical protein